LSGLAEILKRRIERNGPITVADYMAEALGHAVHGYYRGKDRLGADGDFITAPEVSQMFGEMIGLWAAIVWKLMGSPDPFVLGELGPGRGTLMADFLRAGRNVPGFLAAARLHLVERSPGFRQRQAEALAHSGLSQAPVWHEGVKTLPDGPLLLIANEFFDALPIRQLVRDTEGWRERMVGLTKSGGLQFQEGPVVPAPPSVETEEAGAIAEICPHGLAVAAVLARRLAAQGGAALIIDYGYGETAVGDSLQAVSSHGYHDVLSDPGDVDLTAHVDFAALGRAARENGGAVHGPIPQGDFLLRLGIEARLQALLRSARPEQVLSLRAGYRRLLDPAAMGTLFKVMALANPSLPELPGLEARRKPTAT
jgi:NADH dehydrogenase [ubiquinone] 1 alpha subcomplex assembly factor 7